MTVILETSSFLHNYANLSSGASATAKIIDSYDLLALRCPTSLKDHENLLEQICMKTDCDIISLDYGARF